ncbi:hypothetical protein STSP_65240 [Streptomyces jeddahensis]|uniref:Uncharacterized protein n=2 Tax=Streptomyces jeddahensis TaxID=1716141 RepID=A0A177HJD8_9ACTN|nr:hypothetical protein STSP_65240 [Streptomyces jeddahensis]
MLPMHRVTPDILELMDTSDNAEPVIGDTRIGSDGALQHWDGRQWLPYKRQVEAEDHTFRHEEDPEDC